MKSTVSVRTALVFLLAVLAAGAAGGLTYCTGASLPQAFLAGGAAFAVAFPFFDAMVSSS